MDPYCKVTLDGVSHETKTHENGHKNPSWEEQLPALMVGNVDSDVITVELWDRDSMSSDDLIARASVRVSRLANAASNNELCDQIVVPLEPSGELRLRCRFNLDDAAAEVEVRDQDLLNYGMRRGIIELRVREARDLKSCKMMRSMDPYCKVTLDGVSHETKTHENGHKNPSWEEQLPALMVGNVDGDVITVELWDRDSMSSDDLIARASVRVSQLANQNNADGRVQGGGDTRIAP